MWTALGEAVPPIRDQVVITSKFGWNIDQETGQRRPGRNSRPDQMRRVVDGILQRLRTDRMSKRPGIWALILRATAIWLAILIAVNSASFMISGHGAPWFLLPIGAFVLALGMMTVT